MNADWFQITAIVSIAATFLAIVGGVIAIAKFLIDLNAKVTSLETKLSDFKVENQQEHFEIQKQILQLENRFDKYDGVNTDLEKRVAEIQSQQQQLTAHSTATDSQVAELKTQVARNEAQTTERFKQVETDNRDFIKELVQTISR